MTTIVEQLNAAMQWQQQGQFDDAARACQAVLEQEPRNPTALHLLTMSHYAAGRHTDTIATAQRALQVDPANLDTLVVTAHALRAQGQFAEAAAFYGKAVNAQPQVAELRVMYGSTLRAAGQRDSARVQFTQAIALNPNSVQAHNNLAVLHHDVGELEPAITHYRAALALTPQFIEARINLASALRAQKRVEEAMAEFETALTFQPDNAYATAMVFHSKRELCLWQNLEEWTARMRQAAMAQPGAITPFLLFSSPAPLAEILSAATAYAKTFTVPQVMPAPAPASTHTHRKLRIGYFSADFREHVVATVIAEVLERHDRSAFEIVAYSYGPDDGGPQRQRIRNACDDFVDISALSDADAARKIRADGIDILVDLNGYTGNIRHRVPMYRPAPVQISWLGYPGTTGSPAMDYIVADPFVIPDGVAHFYSEKIIRLPGSCQPHDRLRTVSVPQTRAAYGLPETGVVFCSFNHAQKITPEIFKAWMEILRAVAGSVLWLRADRDPVMKNLREAASAAGIDPARLIFAPHTPLLGDHLARYHVADLALDTFPYNSHTTANDALWVGCPLMTLAGETFASRVAGGILQALKLQDLITTTLPAYRDLAIQLATTPGALPALRTRLENAKTAVHFDTKNFVSHLEAAYCEAWRIFASGQKTAHNRCWYGHTTSYLSWKTHE